MEEIAQFQLSDAEYLDSMASQASPQMLIAAFDT